MLRERFGLNEESKNSNADVTLEDKENENDKKICMICDCELTDKEYSQNKLKCNHLCCNECWFRFLSGQINEAKVSSIKCFDYKCETELTETFITQKIIRDISLFQKYKAFKLKAEKKKTPNKKFCPYPGCGSFIEPSWLCEGKYSSKHFEKGQCSGKQFIQADSLQQVREIEIERRNQRGEIIVVLVVALICAHIQIGIVLLYVIISD